MEDYQQEYRVNCCGFRCCKRKHQLFSNPTSNSNKSPSGSYDEINNAVFTGDLPQPLLPGHCITVIGIPLSNCTRFSVNILCESKAKSKAGDIALHFNPRLEQNYVVRNSRQHNHWGTEETVSVYKCAFERENKFTISFFIAPREFMIAINGKHFCTFTYRVPLARMNALEVNGDVTIEDVQVLEMSRYPLELDADHLHVIPFQETHFYGDALLPNPFVGHLPNGFQPGWQLEIFGKIKLLPHSFYVNLQEGNQYWPHPIIPLHLNPRFNTQVGSHSLIRNSWTNGTWGTEERSPVFHFVPGYKFHLVIRMESESFTVWLDDNMCGDFKFRTTVSNIDTVYIQGDLNIFNVFINAEVSNIMLDNMNR